MPRIKILIFCLLPSVAQAQVSADYFLGGAVRVGPSTTTCDAAAKGAIRYNDTGNYFQLCDGVSWKQVLTGAAASDCTPDAFSFTDVTDQSLSTLILSNTLNITGIDAGCVVSVTGSGTPQISVNGGTYTSATTINPGDSLRVKQISSNTVSTARVAAVVVGATTDNWSATTLAGALKMFVTTANYSATGIGSLSGADALCQSQAGTLGYSGTYKALLSDDSTNAKDRVTLTYPIVRATDGTTVIASINLFSGTLDNAIGTSNVSVYTGSNVDGTKGVQALRVPAGPRSAGVRMRVNLDRLLVLPRTQVAVLFHG